MVNISKHPILKECYELCGLIEDCGASEELTKAVVACGDLMENIDIHLKSIPSVNDIFVEIIKHKYFARPGAHNLAEDIHSMLKGDKDV